MTDRTVHIECTSCQKLFPGNELTHIKLHGQTRTGHIKDACFAEIDLCQVCFGQKAIGPVHAQMLRRNKLEQAKAIAAVTSRLRP